MSFSVAIGAAAALLMATMGTASAAGARVSPSPSGAQKMASLNPGTGVPAYKMSATAISVCVKVAAKAGFSFNRTVSTALGQEPQMVVAVSIAMAESSCNPSAVYQDPSSEDRGLWQINNVAWPNVSDACAFQIQCNADAAWNISNHGTNWAPWSTYGNGAWENYVSAARSAVSGGFSFQLENDSAGTCLDADSANKNNGAPIFQWTCNSSDSYQQWTVVDTIGDLFILRNVGTGTCLDADGTNKNNGGPIFQWACSGSDSAQQWWFNGSGQLNTNGNANAGLQNSLNKTCADADSADVGNQGKIFQWACSGSDGYQLWN